MRHLRTLSDISLAVTRGSFSASVHRELSMVLVQNQDYVYPSCVMLLGKAGRQVLPGADTSFLH
jgi:hypothetical protein